MPHELFERFEKAGFLKKKKVNIDAIARASLFEIFELAARPYGIISYKNLSRDNSVLANAASISLGCGRWPCDSLSCRLQRAEQLAQFAALYSDRVYIRYPLSDYISHVDGKHLPDEFVIKKYFAEDMVILNYLRPLIESNKILPISPPHVCLDCLAKHSLGLKDDKQLNKAFNYLNKRMENEINASLYLKQKKIYYMRADGPEDLLEHGFYGLYSDEPFSFLKKMPHILARIKNGDTIHLSKNNLRKIGYAEYLTDMHYQSIIFGLTLSQCLQTGFLTEMPLHVEFLKQFSSTSPRIERDMLIEKHLTCLVPFLKELSPTEILKLRENEEDSFILFKAAITEAVEEYRRNYEKFNEADAKALYSDVLRPKLAELENKVGKGRRSLIKGSRRKILAWTYAISFGVYMGLLPEGLAAAAAFLGLTKVLADFTEGLMNKSDIDESARGHSMYFLWRLKKMSRSK
ncbi:MAG: hypothetical protein ABSH16_01055 [Sedimentisphaerales bacterium]